MAGVSRLQYTPEIRIIRVMCSGRVDLSFVFRAFMNKMDGVYIGGCRLDECNYSTHGNYHALSMTMLAKRIMEYVGIFPDRLRIEFMNASMGQYFAETVNDMVKRIRELGPLGVGEGIEEEELKKRLKGILRLIPYIKIAKREKLKTRLDKNAPETWKDFYTKEEIEELFREIPSYYIDPEKCQACMTCARRCPVDAIDSKKGMVHIIDQEKCIKCGTCFEVCPPKFKAVTKLVRVPVPPPPPEEKRAVKREREKEVA
jgi:coenzyme F420-reducing hydrogenase delta subunit/Fe-S-cluster-containing hydrogenase component 2